MSGVGGANPSGAGGVSRGALVSTGAACDRPASVGAGVGRLVVVGVCLDGGQPQLGQTDRCHPELGNPYSTRRRILDGRERSLHGGGDVVGHRRVGFGK